MVPLGVRSDTPYQRVRDLDSGQAGAVLSRRPRRRQPPRLSWLREAGVHEADSRNGLPDDERQACQSLWYEVGVVIERPAPSKPTPDLRDLPADVFARP
jgi:hypothetical protein